MLCFINFPVSGFLSAGTEFYPLSLSLVALFVHIYCNEAK